MPVPNPAPPAPGRPAAAPPPDAEPRPSGVAAPPLLVGRRDAAAAAGVSVKLFDRLDAAGKTPAAVRVGGRKLYRTADLAAWVALGCPDRREFEARTAGPRPGAPRRPACGPPPRRLTARNETRPAPRGDRPPGSLFPPPAPGVSPPAAPRKFIVVPPLYTPARGDLAARDRETLSRLDLPAAAAAAGLRFAGPASGPWRPCHAAGREDRTPSAALNAVTGVYKDHGTGERGSFWDLLVLLGRFPDWRAARDHHAAAVGTPAAPPTRAAGPVGPAVTRRVRSRRSAPSPDSRVGVLAGRYRDALTPARLNGLASATGLPANVLDGLGVGWSDRLTCWTFPMRAADGAVRGLRTRTPAGAKRAVAGSRDGLFFPESWTGDPPERPARLVVCEGPTDAAALLAWGFVAAGRPSAHGAAGIVGGLCGWLRPAEVVLFADADGPGRAGAENLAAALLPSVPAVRVCEPPAGVKDARAWFLAGADAAAVTARIDAAPARRLRVRGAGRTGGQR